MNKKILFGLLIISMIAVSGCGPEEVAEPATGEAFVGGAKGLDISFIEGAPPDVVYDHDFPFDINVRLENIGEWDIENAEDATVTITGIYADDFGKNLADLKKDSPVSMLGTHLDTQGNVMKGTIANVDFPGFQYQQSVVGRADFNIRAEACYEYGTKANTEICILDDLLGISRAADEKPVCEPNEEKTFENSGAPVRISSVKESITGTDRISISFDIEHIGTGSVYQMNTECSPDIAKRDKVYVEVNTGLTGLICSGIQDGGNEGYTTLYSGKRQIICTQQLPTPRGDYEKPVTIELTYGYKQYTDTELTVKHTGSS